MAPLQDAKEWWSGGCTQETTATTTYTVLTTYCTCKQQNDSLLALLIKNAVGKPRKQQACPCMQRGEHTYDIMYVYCNFLHICTDASGQRYYILALQRIYGPSAHMEDKTSSPHCMLRVQVIYESSGAFNSRPRARQLLAQSSTDRHINSSVFISTQQTVLSLQNTSLALGT